MAPKPRQRVPSRRTLFDSLETTHSKTNLYCRSADLSNEASVEAFFVARMLRDLGYTDSQTKTKASVDTLTVSRGRSKQRYKPDYVLALRGTPRVVIDAKGTNEDPEDWVEQCSSYCLVLNQRFRNSNPVRYFVLTNGLKTLLYRWDSDEPVLRLDFGDFEWGNPRYQALQSILSADAVKTSDPESVTRTRTNDFTFTRPSSARARQLFAQCHKAIWKAEVCSPSAAFMAFAKVMFVKLWCDKRLRIDAATAGYFDPASDTASLPSTAIQFSTRWI